MDKIINEIKSENIKYRDKLNLSDKTTIGMEIEYKKAWDKIIEYKMKRILKNDKWINKYDGSISIRLWQQCFGGEINSPILTDNKKSWEELKKVCEIIKSSNGYINERCGGHIHIGANLLNNDVEMYKKLVKLWYTYEPIIYRFSYGEYEIGRSGIYHYAKSSIPKFRKILLNENDYHDFNAIINDLKPDRNHGINFSNTGSRKNTIEFRCPNSSLNPIIWQNNVNFFGHLLESIQSLEIDEEKYEYIYNKNLMKNTNVKDFVKINIDDAIELANIIFDNEIDKLYFLRQYIKNGEVRNSIEFNKSKKFTI